MVSDGNLPANIGAYCQIGKLTPHKPQANAVLPTALHLPHLLCPAVPSGFHVAATLFDLMRNARHHLFRQTLATPTRHQRLGFPSADHAHVALALAIDVPAGQSQNRLRLDLVADSLGKPALKPFGLPPCLFQH